MAPQKDWEANNPAELAKILAKLETIQKDLFGYPLLQTRQMSLSSKNGFNDYFLFNDFYKKLEEYEFVVGTRLHMCITSVTKNIPAFNISYEVKGKECYEYLGLSDYSIDYNEDSEKALIRFNNFIYSSDKIREHLKKIIPKIHIEALDDFNFFIHKITSI